MTQVKDKCRLPTEDELNYFRTVYRNNKPPHDMVIEAENIQKTLADHFFTLDVIAREGMLLRLFHLYMTVAATTASDENVLQVKKTLFSLTVAVPNPNSNVRVMLRAALSDDQRRVGRGRKHMRHH